MGAVCGLGCDPITGQSLHHDHDIELVFDTLISQEDLSLVRDCLPLSLAPTPCHTALGIVCDTGVGGKANKVLL